MLVSNSGSIDQPYILLHGLTRPSMPAWIPPLLNRLTLANSRSQHPVFVPSRSRTSAEPRKVPCYDRQGDRSSWHLDNHPSRRTSNGIRPSGGVGKSQKVGSESGPANDTTMRIGSTMFGDFGLAKVRYGCACEVISLMKRETRILYFCLVFPSRASAGCRSLPLSEV